MVKKLPKKERQKELKLYLKQNPFATDDDLSEKFLCSVQTIRLDRLELKIPELRKRVKMVAKKNYSKVRSVLDSEFVGELVELDLGKNATSIMFVTPDMVGKKSNVCKGYHIFSQANVLAMALIDADVAVTGSARIRHRRPVYLNEKLTATGFVAKRHSDKYLIKVVSKVDDEEVFVGKFIIVSR